MALTTVAKDPNAKLDYARNWSAWLDGDTIATSTWIVPDGITEETSTHDDTTATIWLSGGTAGTSYQVVNRIVTAGGRTDDRSFIINVRER